MLPYVKPYMEIVAPYLEEARIHTNQMCRGLEAWQIIAFTFGATMLLLWIWDFLFKPDQSKILALYNIPPVSY